MKTFDIEITDYIPTREYYKFDGWKSSIDGKLYTKNDVISNLSWESYTTIGIEFVAEWSVLPSKNVEYVRHDGR